MLRTWNDPEAPWCAKLRRAAAHIQELKVKLEEFEQLKPWSIESEPGSADNEISYRLRVRYPVPSDLVTIVGDAIHNMRSSLDAVAFELARQHLDGAMNAAHESATEFPIKPDSVRFAAFFNNAVGPKGKKFRRREMYSLAQIGAFRLAQSFAIPEDAAAHGIEWTYGYDEAHRHDVLHRLHTLSIVDKHRRLPVLALFPDDLIYWSSNEGDDQYQWRPAKRAVIFEDGSLLGHFSNLDGPKPPTADLYLQMRLVLGDDPAGPHSSMADTLVNWHQQICTVVIPQVFRAAYS